MFNELITGEHGDFSIKPVYGTIECTDEHFGVADPNYRHRCWCVGTQEQQSLLIDVYELEAVCDCGCRTDTEEHKQEYEEELEHNIEEYESALWASYEQYMQDVYYPEEEHQPLYLGHDVGGDGEGDTVVEEEAVQPEEEDEPNYDYYEPEEPAIIEYSEPEEDAVVEEEQAGYDYYYYTPAAEGAAGYTFNYYYGTYSTVYTESASSYDYDFWYSNWDWYWGY